MSSKLCSIILIYILYILLYLFILLCLLYSFLKLTWKIINILRIASMSIININIAIIHIRTLLTIKIIQSS